MTVTLQHPRYHFDRYLASGGMGEVWQATDTLLDREVAVKVLRRELAEDPVLRARFAAEARHAGALQHPHVASVLDYGEITGQAATPLPFLVMELVEGQPLSALLAGEQPVAPEVAADVIAQAADGIEAAHAIGIVHRDVKPGNLLVTAGGQVKVTDFGVARAADTASLTTTGHLIGTPHYLSPEQAEGGSATAVSDVYSLGIVLYECLTGRKPFAGETPVATAVMQIRDPLPAFPEAVPDRLQRIARIATAKEPAQRFRSAGAMAAALRDESPDTRSYLLPGAAADPGALAPVTDEHRHRELLSARRVLIGLVVLLLVSGGLWAATVSPDSPTGPSTAEASSEDGEDLVRVRPRAFVGLPVAKASSKLERRGLRPRTERQDNPGGEEPGTVAAVSPTGLLEPGTRVQLSVWARPPAPPAPPTPETDAPAATSDADGGAASGGSGAENGSGAAGDRGGAAPGTGPPGNAPANSNAGGNGNGPASNSAAGNGNGPGSNTAGGNGGGNGGGKPGKGGKR